MKIQPVRRALLATSLLAGVLVAGTGPARAAGSGEEARELFQQAMGGPECAPTAGHECGQACHEAYRGSKQLGSLLVQDPGALESVAPMFRAAFEAGGSDRDRALGFLASCGSEGCVGLADALYAAAPEGFSERQLLAFAEAGSRPMQRELEQRVQAGHCESALPAAWLAFRRDARGQPALERAVSAEVSAGNAGEILIAAGALTALGDERALGAARERIHAAVLAALDADRLDEARAIALSADMLRKPLDKACASARYAQPGYAAAKGKAGAFRISPLEKELAWYLRREQLATADQVFELIESISPLS